LLFTKKKRQPPFFGKNSKPVLKKTPNLVEKKDNACKTGKIELYFEKKSC